MFSFVLCFLAPSIDKHPQHHIALCPGPARLRRISMHLRWGLRLHLWCLRWGRRLHLWCRRWGLRLHGSASVSSAPCPKCDVSPGFSATPAPPSLSLNVKLSTSAFLAASSVLSFGTRWGRRLLNRQAHHQLHRKHLTCVSRDRGLSQWK